VLVLILVLVPVLVPVLVLELAHETAAPTQATAPFPDHQSRAPRCPAFFRKQRRRPDLRPKRRT
jgi:hypothetical protein